MDAKGIDSIQLAYFGRADPRVYGITFRPLDQQSSHHWAAISASFLMGRPYFWYADGKLQEVHVGTYAWLHRYQPIDRVGSMFVYDLP